MLHYELADEYLHRSWRAGTNGRNLNSLNARLMVRRGRYSRRSKRICDHCQARGLEDFGVNYYMGIVCLADKRAEARRNFESIYQLYGRHVRISSMVAAGADAAVDSS